MGETPSPSADYSASESRGRAARTPIPEDLKAPTRSRLATPKGAVPPPVHPARTGRDIDQGLAIAPKPSETTAPGTKNDPEKRPPTKIDPSERYKRDNAEAADAGGRAARVLGAPNLGAGGVQI